MPGMTNAQAALIAAASQVSSVGGVTVTPDGPKSISQAVATKLRAAEYVTWLDQQDELSKRLAQDE